MHIAIDDTYSSNVNVLSQYVTSDRRTNVAVCFDDDDVPDIRKQLLECLEEINTSLHLAAKEFHFVEIANRKKQWASLPKDKVLPLFGVFIQIYNHYKWPVLIQTVDHRTLDDHCITLQGSIDGIDLGKKEGQSLMMLLTRLKQRFRAEPRITLIMDEGAGSPKQPFAKTVFADYKGTYIGYFESSKDEPLLQIADFIAYVVNRSTNLVTRTTRSSDDDLFISIAGSLQLNSSDVAFSDFFKSFGQAEFDNAHREDRKNKGLEV